jgi:Tol biopolymer transport system component
MMARLATLTALVALFVVAVPASASSAPRNGAIAYYQSTGGPEADSPETRSLLIQRPGGEPRVVVRCQLVTDVPTGGDCTARQFSSPSWSPDGRTLVFDAGRQIGVVAAAGGPVRLLPAVSSDDGDPVFEPGGKLIYFTAANDHGSTDVYFRRVDGTDFPRLVVHDASQPAPSPRGGVLVYVRSGNLYLQKAGGHRQRVTSGVSPDWAPNGRRLVFIRPRASLTFDLPVGRIFSIRGSGRGLTRVGTEDYASHPVWSPDGRWIAYDGLDLGVYTQRLRRSSQAHELAPTQFSGESGFVSSAFPAWRPVR